jgi:hypothetical protein
MGSKRQLQRGEVCLGRKLISKDNRLTDGRTGIDLSSLQKQLDAEASEIITNQRDDLVERKEVAQKTKDFRKLSDPDKLVEYKGLLKG